MGTPTIEERLTAVEARMAVLERATAPDPIPSPRAVVRSGDDVTAASRDDAPPAPAAARAAVAARAAALRDWPRPEPLADVFGGRVLAWVGGVAVALGIGFLLAIAVSRGWIGEVERTVLAGGLSLALLAVGLRGRSPAALAAAGAGLAGGFATCAVAGSVYALVPAVVALVGALAVGAVATVAAVRRDAPGLAALGILGALVSPALVGATPGGAGVAMLLVAAASAAGVLVWRRWTWLAFAAFVITTPQWLLYLTGEPGSGAAVAVLAGFGSVAAVSAVGHAVRSASAPRAGSALLLALNALVLAGAGAVVLGDGWLVALALAHVAGGLAARRAAPRDLALVVLALAVVLADVAVAALLDGLPAVAVWAGGAGGLALLARRAAPGGNGERVLLTGLGGHLALALAHALVLQPPHSALGAGPADLAALVGLGAVAAACLVSSQLAGARDSRIKLALDATALAVLAYQTAVALDGVALTIALAAEAAALAVVARRAAGTAGSGSTDPSVLAEPAALAGAAAYAALALGHALALFAPPDALASGLAAPGPAAVALLAVAAAGAAIAGLAPLDPRVRTAAWGAVAVTVLYAVSVELVTPFDRQEGQALLSGLWALAGVGALLAGLIKDDAPLRTGALTLLAVTVGKVFLVDLASLTSLYRVASFVALGLLLLAAAFAWQRLRPGPAGQVRAPVLPAE